MSERLAEALQRIRDARDHCAEYTIYPSPPNGPAEDQLFDDWAADVAGQALELARPLEGDAVATVAKMFHALGALIERCEGFDDAEPAWRGVLEQAREAHAEASTLRVHLDVT